MKKIITAIGFAMMLAGLTAYANATVDVCDYDRDTKVAVVSGTATCDEVTLCVNNGETVFYEGQQEVKEGTYKFSFRLEGEAVTDFSVTVSGTKETPVSNDMTYYGNKVEETFSKLNEYAKAQNASAFQELFTNSLDILGMKLSDESESAVGYMSNVLMLQAPYSKVSEMKTAFDTAKYLYDASTISDGKELDALIRANKERFVKQYPNVFEVYESCEEAVREEICKDIISAVNHKVVTDESFKEVFVVQTMRRNIRTAEGWSAARDLLAKTKSEIRITASKLTDISDVYIGMINSDYSAIGDFEKVYTEKLKAAENSRNQGSGGGSSGGSSGGGSSKGGNSTFVPQVPVQPEKNETTFSDIDNVKWAKTAIEGLAKAKIINGRSENIFDPDAPVLREEFIKMLILAFDINIHEDAVRFDDAGSGEWFAEYANTAKYEGIVSGMGDNTFGAGQNITRQDMVTITYRAMEKFNMVEEKDEEETAFSDNNDIAEYARNGIYYLKSIKVVNGRESNRFDPQDNISRAEAAKILYSVRNIKIEKDYVVEENVE